MTERLVLGLVGNPNCGKSALFNALTGLRQKVANYPGATVERRIGQLSLRESLVDLVDLPGTYSLSAKSPDEEVTRAVLMGEQKGERRPDLIICVVDATNLAQHLRFVIELKSLGLPMVVALNMMDLAARDGIEIDIETLAKKLDIPVVETVAVRGPGSANLLAHIETRVHELPIETVTPTNTSSIIDLQKEARSIAEAVTIAEGVEHKASRVLDSIILHNVMGPIVLVALLFLMFQAVYAWAAPPMDLIESSIMGLQGWLNGAMSESWVKSLLLDGVIAGVGSVIIFLPQIIILFAFILTLEGSGYMARAAFLMDRLMAKVGLNGRAFIPLLSSFACAIPGIMAARTISNPRDRLTTILIAPLMTCSARLPVYTLIIAAFIPDTTVLGGMGLQGVVLFALYMFGIVSALIIAYVFKRTLAKGVAHPLIMELPKYQMPGLRYLMIGLYERVGIFLKRAGRIILLAMIVLWFLSSYPAAPIGMSEPDIYYSFAGYIGRGLSYIFAPIGFNWEISIALVPGMAAREVAVAALGTVYSLQGSEDAVTASLSTMLNGAWSLPTALSFLAWYIYAPMCLSTLAVAKRETNSRKWAWFMAGYMFTIAYTAAFLTFRISSALVS